MCLYFMGLNLSTRPIAQELDLTEDDVQGMTGQRRAGLVAKSAPTTLAGAVDIDTVYGIAGHKGHPAEVAQKGGAAGGAA